MPEHTWCIIQTWHDKRLRIVRRDQIRGEQYFRDEHGDPIRVLSRHDKIDDARKAFATALRDAALKETFLGD